MWDSHSDQGSINFFCRWTLNSWIPVAGLPCTWPPHWGTWNVPVCSWHMVQMWAGRIAVVGQVGTLVYFSPESHVGSSLEGAGGSHCVMSLPSPVLQEAVSTRDLELVQLVLRYRDYQRVVKRLAGIPMLLEKLRKVRPGSPPAHCGPVPQG